MATILEFRGDAERLPAKAGRRRRRSAQIVIFPGVRYERYNDSAPEARSGSPGVERDFLKLVD